MNAVTEDTTNTMMNIVTQHEIIETIRSILREKLQVDAALLTGANDTTPLTGQLFSLQARDLVYLFAFVQDAFHIEVPGAALADEGFNSIASIADIVRRAMS